MPYDSANGRVYAPVGEASVALAIGEASLDTTTLCRSDKINPYSLIRPLYYETDVPGTDPEFFYDSDNPSGLPLKFVPAAHRSRLFPTAGGGAINIAAKSATDYPVLNQYAFTNPTYIKYTSGKWGFVIPYVTAFQDVIALKDFVWERFYPSDDTLTNGLLQTCWANLHQFDGYLQNDLPINPVRNAVIEYGEPLSVVPSIDIKHMTKAQILGKDSSGAILTKNHPGGVVNIMAVLGEGGQFGVSFYKKVGSGKYSFVNALLYGPLNYQLVGNNDGIYEIPYMGLNQYAGNKADWLIIPWYAKDCTFTTQEETNSVNNKKSKRITGISGDNRKIYAFTYGKELGFKGYAEGSIDPAHIQFGDAFGNQDVTVSGADMSGNCSVTFALKNMKSNYPLTAQDFYIEYNYRNADGNTTKRGVTTNTAWTGNHANLIPSAYQRASTTVVDGAQDGSTGNIITVTRAPMTLGVVYVTIKFKMPDTNYLNNTPSVTKIAFTNVDSNHTVTMTDYIVISNASNGWSENISGNTTTPY